MEAARARLAAGGASGAAPDGARPCKEHSSLAGGGLEGCEAERPRAEPGLPPSIAQRMLIVSRVSAQQQVSSTRRQMIENLTQRARPSVEEMQEQRATQRRCRACARIACLT